MRLLLRTINLIIARNDCWRFCFSFVKHKTTEKVLENCWRRFDTNWISNIDWFASAEPRKKRERLKYFLELSLKQWFFGKNLCVCVWVSLNVLYKQMFMWKYVCTAPPICPFHKILLLRCVDILLHFWSCIICWQNCCHCWALKIT